MEMLVRACVILFAISCLGNVSNGAAVTTSSPTSAPMLNYKCNSSGIVSITEDNDKMVLIENGKYCSLGDSTCSWQSKKKIQVLYSPDENNTSIIVGGRKVYYYNLECVDAKEYDANASTIFTAERATDKIRNETVEPTIAADPLKLTITNTNSQKSIHIGDELDMTLTGPDGYKVLPTKCTAYPGQVGGNPSYELWSSCKSLDTAVIDKNWVGKGNSTTVKLYAFRFVDSNTVAIFCSAHLCPEEKTCTQDCSQNNSGRRRRDTNLLKSIEDGSMDDTASASFTIVDEFSTPNSSPGIQPFMLFSVTCTWIATVIMKN